MCFRLGVFVIGATAALMSLTACAGGGAKEPVVRLNAQPQQRYALILHTDQAPGGFDRVEGEVLYRVEKPQCLAWKEKFAGVTVEARHRMAIPMVRQDATTYVGTFALDQIQDEDYYGMGVCHWSVNILTVDATRQGTVFSAAFSGSEAGAGGSRPTYFFQRDYAAASQGQGPQYAEGTSNRDLMRLPFFSLDLEVRPLNP